jgi:hypothetical protein
MSLSRLSTRSCLLLLTVLHAGRGVAQTTEAESSALARRLGAVPTEVSLANGSLRIINIYQLEASILLRSQNRPPAEIVDQLARDVYTPYASFWQGYLGDEASFREWAATKLLATGHPIQSSLSAVLDLDLDGQFTQSSKWIYEVSGKQPRGTWYIVFGPGWTDMGGLGDIGMVLDFTRQKPTREAIEFVLPHELTHQVNAARPKDPDQGTVLQRIVSEGLASYAAYVYAAGRQTPAQCLLYTSDEWQWAVAHENQLIVAAHPYLASKERKDDERLAARNQRLLEGGPAAAGYFLGFRIMQQYIEKKGAKSWTEAIDLPVREVLAKSGYPL